MGDFMINHKNTFADITGMAVLYLGENVHQHFQFGNGSVLVSHLFETLPEAVERFGRRIVTNNDSYKFSGPYIDGIEAAKAGKPYAPTRSHGRQAVLEYGTGYLRGLIEKTPVAPAVKDTLTEKEHNAMMDKAEGRSK
jgi:hypothetical protein